MAADLIFFCSWYQHITVELEKLFVRNRYRIGKSFQGVVIIFLIFDGSRNVNPVFIVVSAGNITDGDYFGSLLINEVGRDGANIAKSLNRYGNFIRHHAQLAECSKRYGYNSASG